MWKHRVSGVKAFYVIWIALLLSFTASGITRFGLSVWVFDETRDPQAFSTLLFFATIPVAVGSIFAGPIADRWDRRNVLIVSNISASLPTVAIMGLYFVGQLQLWHLYVALFINGITSAFLLPTLDASIRVLVPSDKLAQASGLSQMVQSLGTIIAPPLAGVLLIEAGLGLIFVLDFVTVIAAALILWVVTIPQSPRVLDLEAKNVWQDLGFGLRYIKSQAGFVFLIGFLTLVIFAQSFVYALTGPLVLSFASETALGWVYGAFGVGGLIGAILISVTGGMRPRMYGILLSAMGMGITAILVSLRPEVMWILLGVFGFGMAMSALITLNRTIYQEHAAPEVLGRIFAFRVIVGVSAQALGLLLAGHLAAAVFEPAMLETGSLSPIFGDVLGVGVGRGAALLTLLTGLAIVILTTLCALIPALRRLEDTLPGGLKPSIKG
jgi:MFS family permease